MGKEAAEKLPPSPWRSVEGIKAALPYYLQASRSFLPEYTVHV
jgi:hypothetical protein